MIDFWIDFLPKLAPCWDPSWDPRAAPDGPKTPPRRSQDATKTAQEPQESPRPKFGPMLVDFWSMLGPFLIDVGSIFHWFWVDSWLIFKHQKNLWQVTSQARWRESPRSGALDIDYIGIFIESLNLFLNLYFVLGIILDHFSYRISIVRYPKLKVLRNSKLFLSSKLIF